MAVNAQRPPPARGGMPRVILVGMTMVGLVMVVLVGSFIVWRWHLRRKINGRIATIHAAGLPVNWSELDKWPEEVPDSENGALLYTNAFVHLVPDGLTDDYRFDLPRRGDAISNKLRASMIAAVETNREALKLIDSAADFQRFRYPVKYMEGPNAKLPHLNGLTQTVRLLACEAFLKSSAGDAVSAEKAIETSFRAARSLDDEPLLISQLTADRLLIMSSRSLERVLCQNALSDDSLTKIETEIVGAEATNRFVTALIGERALNGEIIRLAQDDVRQMIDVANQGAGDDDKTERPSRDPGIGWRFLGFFERDRNFYLRAMETNILVVGAMPPTSLSLTNETEKLAVQARQGFYICSAMFLPSLSKVAERDAFMRGYLRVAMAGVAVERWRLAHGGEIPDSLDAVIPSFLSAVPLDPYDGRPLRFKKLPRGYVVYSIGPDRKDDGGKELLPPSVKVPREQRLSYDITFTVER